MSKTFTAQEISTHNGKTDDAGIWIIVDNVVYDLSKFITKHPGGPRVIKRVAGRDASKQFWKYHNDGVLKKYGDQLKVGELETKAKL